MKIFGKRLLLLLLVSALCGGICACGGNKNVDSDTVPDSGIDSESSHGNSVDSGDDESETEDDSQGDQADPQLNSLDGKKIIFVGNSYTYYGQTVLEKSQAFLTQQSRMGDVGYFYQLCKANGMNVEVTNWTFGGHGLKNLFGGSCTADRGCDGKDHKAYLTDANYDYVVIQPGSGSTSDSAIKEDMEMVMNFFRAANPNVKFAILVPYSHHGTLVDSPYLHKNILNSLKTLAADGVTVVDWGGLVIDIVNGTVKVPDATQEYVKNTFVIRKSSTDGYHPNQLSGYITTLMTYCALTGASAVGQPYDFCNNGALRPAGGSTKFFSFSSFISTYYTNGATTNYPNVFASKTDMTGIQSLIDSHLAAKKYTDFNYTTDSDTTSPSEDAEAVAAGKVAKVINNGVTTYITKAELETKLKAYTNGDHITLLTNVSCQGPTSSSNMKSVKNMSVTFDLNGKTLTLTKGSIMRSSSSAGYSSTFHLLSSNGKGTLTLAEGNTYTAFQIYGGNKTVIVGSEEGYTDGDCVEINCGRLMFASTYNYYSQGATSTSSFTVYGGAINQTAENFYLIGLYQRGAEGKYNDYYMGTVSLIGTTITQKISCSSPLFQITCTDTAESLRASDYGDAPGFILTDCTITGYSDSAWIHDMETLNAKITYNNCTIKGNISKIGTDVSDTGLGKVVLGENTTFTVNDTSTILPYSETALKTYEASSSGIYLANGTVLGNATESGRYEVILPTA